VGADISLVVQDGRIIEQGSHKELMAKRGAYYRLFTRQYEELAADRICSEDRRQA
jgi:ATP-binding cassette subfamily B protein